MAGRKRTVFTHFLNNLRHLLVLLAVDILTTEACYSLTGLPLMNLKILTSLSDAVNELRDRYRPLFVDNHPSEMFTS